MVHEYGNIRCSWRLRPSEKAPNGHYVRSAWPALLLMLLVMLLAANLLGLASAEGSVDVVSITVSSTDLNSTTKSEKTFPITSTSTQGIRPLTDSLGRTTATTAAMFTFRQGGFGSPKHDDLSTLQSVSEPSSGEPLETSVCLAPSATANIAESSSAANFSVWQNDTRNVTVSRESNGNAPPFSTGKSITGRPCSDVVTEFSVIQTTVAVTAAAFIDATGLNSTTIHLSTTVFVTASLPITPSNTSITALAPSFSDGLSICFGSHDSFLAPTTSTVQITAPMVTSMPAPAENESASDSTAAIASASTSPSNMLSTSYSSPSVLPGLPAFSLTPTTFPTALTPLSTSLITSQSIVPLLEPMLSSLPPSTTTTERTISPSQDSTGGPPSTSIFINTLSEQTRVIPVTAAAVAEMRGLEALSSSSAETLTASSSAPKNLLAARTFKPSTTNLHHSLEPSSINGRSRVSFFAATSSASRTKPPVQNMIGKVKKGAAATETWLAETWRRFLENLGTIGA